MSSSLPFTLNLLPMWQVGHADASGYGRIIDFMDGRIIDRIDRSEDWTFTRRLTARAFRPIYERSGSRWYHRESFMTELAAARYWFREQGQVFHFLYGEQCFRYFGHLKRLSRRNAIVCTYHTPPDKFRQMVTNTGHMKYIDALIVLSSMQVDFFSELVGAERVFYVPRSVDVDYFRPAEHRRQERDTFECLFVGHFLRDFDTMAEAARIVHGRNRLVHFTVVTRPQYHDRFAGSGNVTVLHGIPDDRLLELYQQADLFVLPLLDATANNAVVEAMACGMPVVSNEIPGVKDYVTPDCAVLTPRKDPGALADAILSLYDQRSTLEAMRLKSRARALDFRIDKIAARTREVYRHAAVHFN